MATTTRKTETAAKGFADFFKLPSFDMNAMLEQQRKNIEAVVEANRVALEGYKAVSEKQAEVLRQGIEESSKAAREAFNAKTPEANAEKQYETFQGLAKVGFENARDVTDLVIKTHTDAFAVIQKRFTDGIEEAKTQQAA